MTKYINIDKDLLNDFIEFIKDFIEEEHDDEYFWWRNTNKALINEFIKRHG